MRAVAFSAGKCALYPSASCNLRTVFLLTKDSSGGLYLFGKNGQDLSFRVGDSSINLHGQFNFNPVGALFHVNGGSVRNFSQLSVTDSIVLDVVNGVISPMSLYGDVTFGTAANGHDIPVYVDDWRTLDAAHPNQPAVSVLPADGSTPPTVTGTLHPAAAMPNWALSRSGTVWYVARTGMVIIFR